MSTEKTFPISEARKNIFKIADMVQRPATYVTLTEKGRPKAVMLSVEEFQSWVETLEVVQDFPNLKRDIAAAHEDFKKGEYIVFSSDVSAPKKRIHAVRRRPSQKSSKRSSAC